MDNNTPTYDELMSREDASFIAEHGGYLYVKLPAREHYDNTIWKVDKSTHEVFYMMFTEYISTIDDKAHYIKKPDWMD